MPLSPALAKLSSIVGVAATILLLDWFYLTYITSHGFDLKTQDFTLGSWRLSVPLQWLPVIGILLVSLVCWYEAASRLFPRRAPEADPLARLRLLRVVVFSVALFACVLYIPYLIGSNWFWTRLSELSKSITQIRDIGLTLLHTDESAMGLSPLLQYSLSQILATGSMVFSAWAFARVGRRPRKQR